MNKLTTVRVIHDTDSRLNPPIPGVWLEQLRYMGLVRILAPATAHTKYEVLEFSAPPKTNAEVWARQNAERMASFGINAVAAPPWRP